MTALAIVLLVVVLALVGMQFWIPPSPADAGPFAAMRLGFRVDRATGNLAQTGALPLFNVKGGRVAILGIVGEVTTVIQTQANATKITANPDVGTSVDLCGTLDITADEVGCLYGITGIPADALVGANAGASPLAQRPVVVNKGTIDLDCAASNTGKVKWACLYLPIDEGAYVEAA